MWAASSRKLFLTQVWSPSIVLIGVLDVLRGATLSDRYSAEEVAGTRFESHDNSELDTISARLTGYG